MLAVKLFTFFVCIFGWQHLGRVYDVTMRPSYFVTQVAIFSEFCWGKLGTFVAYLGSYYHYLVNYSHELVMSVMELGSAFSRFIISYMYFFSGFWETAKSYAQPNLILVGSVLLGVFIVGLALWYFNIDISQYLKIGETSPKKKTFRKPYTGFAQEEM